MLLTTKHWAISAWLLASCIGLAQAQTSLADSWRYQYNANLGFDYWDIDQKADSARLQRLAYLPDGSPQWTYRNPSPWIHYDSNAWFSPNLTGNFKFRGNQSSDWRIDELNLSWSVSPSWGITAGVVDYKTSWCRSYDIDSIWVRENDPFCTVRSTEQGTGAAPGLQAFANGTVNDHVWQAQMGWYDALLLDYDTEEFNLQALPHDSRVKRNKKYGISFSSVHIPTGSEMRISYLHTNQVADYQPGRNLAFYDKPQDVDVIFLGFGFYIAPSVKVRLTHLKSELDSRFFPTDGNQAFWIYDVGFLRESSTAEVYWQLSPIDSLAVGYSWYEWNEVVNITYKPNTRFKYQLNQTDFQNRLWSIAWRRDWTKQFFTAVQWTKAKAKELDYDLFDVKPEDLRSSGQAIGVRMGLRF